MEDIKKADPDVVRARNAMPKLLSFIIALAWMCFGKGR
jgi:hypothetical protein